MSTTPVTRRGFVGALLALPLLSRLRPAPVPSPVTVPMAESSAESFDDFIRAHELDLRHVEARLQNDLLSLRDRDALEAEHERLLKRYSGPFKRADGISLSTSGHYPRLNPFGRLE